LQAMRLSTAEVTTDSASRERLILDYLPLVRAVARDFVREDADLDDLVQVGTIGLIKAVDRFDARRGVDFAAFARPTVTGEIQRHLRDAVPTVRPPRRMHELNGRLRRLRRELGSRLGRPASIRELAEAAGTSTAEAGAATALDRGTTVPIDGLSVRAGDPYAESEDRLFVSSCLDSLHERERRILELRFYGELSQREIARELGISQIHVSRLIERSLRTLQRRAERGPLTRIVVPVSNSYTESDGASGKAHRRAQAHV
jgi:RNA polymerase sigma-B factor